MSRVIMYCKELEPLPDLGQINALVPAGLHQLVNSLLAPRRSQRPVDAAAALSRSRFFGRETISFLVILPIALPGIVTGIALRSAYGLSGIPFGFWTIVVGHATFCIVVVYNNAVARLRRTSPSLIEASMDLGADAFQTLRYVLLPSLGTALLAGGMLAFALSFDEVIVTTFTAGQQTTLPIWMLQELVRPRQRPVTNVVAVVIVALTFIPILAAYYLTRGEEHASGGRL